jgi:DNA polymerase-3 subunit delta
LICPARIRLHILAAKQATGERCSPLRDYSRGTCSSKGILVSARPHPRPAFTLCLCPDSRLLRDRIDGLLAAHPPAGAPASSSWRRLTFWADEGLGGAFWDQLTLRGLFAAPKAIVLRGAQALPADTLKTLGVFLLQAAARGGDEAVWPILCFEVPFDRGKAKLAAHIPRLPLWRTAEEKGWIEEIPGLSVQGMPAHIRREAARLGLALSAPQANELAQGLPPDAARIHSELAKLALLAGADGRLPADAGKLTESGREPDIFELMHIMQHSGDSPAAWRRILEDRLSGENSVFACIGLLLREARLLWQILAGSDPWLHPGSAARKTAGARQLGFAGVARLWAIALAADKGIKSGERDPDQALEMLAADLFRLFTAARAGKA